MTNRKQQPPKPTIRIGNTVRLRSREGPIMVVACQEESTNKPPTTRYKCVYFSHTTDGWQLAASGIEEHLLELCPPREEHLLQPPPRSSFWRRIFGAC